MPNTNALIIRLSLILSMWRNVWSCDRSVNRLLSKRHTVFTVVYCVVGVEVSGQSCVVICSGISCFCSWDRTSWLAGQFSQYFNSWQNKNEKSGIWYSVFSKYFLTNFFRVSERMFKSFSHNFIYLVLLKCTYFYNGRRGDILKLTLQSGNFIWWRSPSVCSFADWFVRLSLNCILVERWPDWSNRIAIVLASTVLLGQSVQRQYSDGGRDLPHRPFWQHWVVFVCGVLAVRPQRSGVQSRFPGGLSVHLLPGQLSAYSGFYYLGQSQRVFPVSS